MKSFHLHHCHPPTDNRLCSSIRNVDEKTSPHEKAKEQLKNLAKLIQENPSLIVQISTHTDCRGSKEYNARLSRRRAESVERYLSSLGISSEQVVLTWHGEEQLVNNCTDGKDCDDLAHEKNRRAEFAFITEEMTAELRK